MRNPNLRGLLQEVGLWTEPHSARVSYGPLLSAAGSDQGDSLYVLLSTCHFHLESIKCLQVTLVYASPRTMTRGPTCHKAPVCMNTDRAARVAGYQLWRHVLLPHSFHKWWGLDFVGSHPQPGNPRCLKSDGEVGLLLPTSTRDVHNRTPPTFLPVRNASRY